MSSIVRVSILTIPEGRIDEAAEAMRKAEEELRGILKLKGLRAYFAGVDRARSQLTNVSVWDSLESAEQMSSFQPMLNLGKRFAADGATFLRPIPNFDCLWQWGDIGGPGTPNHCASAASEPAACIATPNCRPRQQHPDLFSIRLRHDDLMPGARGMR